MCFFLFLELDEGEALGVARGLVSGNADVSHVPAFSEDSLYPAVGHIFGQKFL